MGQDLPLRRHAVGRAAVDLGLSVGVGGNQDGGVARGGAGVGLVEAAHAVHLVVDAARDVLDVLHVGPGTGREGNVLLLGKRTGNGLCLECPNRVLYVQANMSVRRFHRCSVDVKINLFRGYCSPLYTAPLWVKYKRESLRKLKVALQMR